MTIMCKCLLSRIRWGTGLTTYKRLVPTSCSGFGAFLAMLLAVTVLHTTLQGQTGINAESTELDRAISSLNEARLALRDVRDYECRLVKRERVNGKLLPESVMIMKFRSKPMSVYLRCLSPEDDKGMEVCYVEGTNQGMMRVQPAGVIGSFGFWSVGIHDARAFEKNRHCIKDAGLGTLLESTARYWEMERKLNKTLVSIRDEVLNGRNCTCIETTHPDRYAGSFYGYRCLLWLDKETHLPAGAETYDWPRRGGAAAGELLESYRYQNLRCNLGLGNDVFDH